MLLDLYLAGLLYSFGAVIFNRFEERTAISKRLRKLVFYHGIAALLVFTVGRPWSLLWIFGMMSIGLTFHFWWTLKHQIHPLTAEPRETYYALRGWES